MGSNQFRATLLILALGCAGLALPGPAAAQVKGRFLLFGSSSVNGSFGRVIVDDLAKVGLKVDRHGFSSAGLARPDFRDLRQVMDGLPLEKSVNSVMLYIGGNDAQGLWLRPGERSTEKAAPWIWWKDERWPSVYEARATELIRSLCARGMQHTIVLPPADVRSERLQGRLDRIRTILKRAAEATKCGRYVSTAGDLKSFALEGDSLRTRDGVHMTTEGAHRVWKRVRDAVLKLARVR